MLAWFGDWRYSAACGLKKGRRRRGEMSKYSLHELPCQAELTKAFHRYLH